MKKWLSILGTIGLTATSTTSLISCEKPNNNENGGENKPKPEKPQEPPIESKWKLINQTEFLNLDKKWSVVILDDGEEKIWRIIKFDIIWEGYETRLKVLNNLKSANHSKYEPKFYLWNKNDEPQQIPEINKNTGKITDWKG